jgi:putative tricarboxylic transport membrane protein
MKSFGLLLAASFVAALCAFNASSAADWKPDKRVEIVVPNAAGGGNDRIARLAQRIIQEQRLVDSVVTVVNKPGAGVVMGLTYLNQHPDGNSISIISATFLGDAISGRSSMSLTDITPIAQLFTEYVAFAVKTDASGGEVREVQSINAHVERASPPRPSRTFSRVDLAQLEVGA